MDSLIRILVNVNAILVLFLIKLLQLVNHKIVFQANVELVNIIVLKLNHVYNVLQVILVHFVFYVKVLTLQIV